MVLSASSCPVLADSRVALSFRFSKKQILNNFSLSPFGFAHKFESLFTFDMLDIFLLLFEANKFPLILIWNKPQQPEHYHDSSRSINNRCWGTYAELVKLLKTANAIGLFGLSESLMTALFSVNTAKFVSTRFPLVECFGFHLLSALQHTHPIVIALPDSFLVRSTAYTDIQVSVLPLRQRKSLLVSYHKNIIPL